MIKIRRREKTWWRLNSAMFTVVPTCPHEQKSPLYPPRVHLTAGSRTLFSGYRQIIFLFLHNILFRRLHSETPILFSTKLIILPKKFDPHRPYPSATTFTHSNQWNPPLFVSQIWAFLRKREGESSGFERTMDEKLIQRLESAVTRLEALSTGFRPGGAPESGEDAVSDPSILAFDDLMGQYVGRVTTAAEKIGGQVLEVTKVLKEAFSVQRELLVRVKQTQVC